MNLHQIFNFESSQPLQVVQDDLLKNVANDCNKNLCIRNNHKENQNIWQFPQQICNIPTKPIPTT